MRQAGVPTLDLTFYSRSTGTIGSCTEYLAFWLTCEIGPRRDRRRAQPTHPGNRPRRADAPSHIQRMQFCKTTLPLLNQLGQLSRTLRPQSHSGGCRSTTHLPVANDKTVGIHNDLVIKRRRTKRQKMFHVEHALEDSRSTLRQLPISKGHRAMHHRLVDGLLLVCFVLSCQQVDQTITLRRTDIAISNSAF